MQDLDQIDQIIQEVEAEIEQGEQTLSKIQTALDGFALKDELPQEVELMVQECQRKAKLAGKERSEDFAARLNMPLNKRSTPAVSKRSRQFI